MFACCAFFHTLRIIIIRCQEANVFKLFRFLIRIGMLLWFFISSNSIFIYVFIVVLIVKWEKLENVFYKFCGHCCANDIQTILLDYCFFFVWGYSKKKLLIKSKYKNNNVKQTMLTHLNREFCDFVFLVFRFFFVVIVHVAG